MATAADKMFSIKLTENDVPGAKFHSSEISMHSVVELRRWLQCRGLSTSGIKQELVDRCRVCIEAGGADDIIVEGRWYEQKVASVLKQVRDDTSERVPFLPLMGWQDFPACTLPKGFCYGNIFHHIISSARTHTVDQNDSDSDGGASLTDFGTSKPMIKGRKYFSSGHVKNIKHQEKGQYQFFKSTVMASYTLGTKYNVSITVKSPSGSVCDATCECKASAMGRCTHVAGLLFAIDDYIMNFGYDVATTSKLCAWNTGRKHKRDPQPCHTARYSKKLKSDRMIDFDPRTEPDDTFVNTFISTLPNVQSKTMLEQVLEIDYEEYIVNKEELKKMTKVAIDNLKSASTSPYEVPNTRSQANSETWHSHRRIRITASVAKEISSVKTARGRYNLLRKHLWGSGLPQLKALQYGRNNENSALECYRKTINENNFNVTQSGLWVNPKYPELAASPDGLLFSSDNILTGVIEIKCPLVLQNIHPLDITELPPKQRYNLCYTVDNGKMKLKPTHQYYFQIQMQMAICDVQLCDFVVWSPQGILVEQVERDSNFWDDLLIKLIDFHHNVLLPEYFEMRIPRKLMPIDLRD